MNASTVALRKKLIEVSIPLEAINVASKKQKAPKGYPTALHKYWAQRPISACRGVLFAQLVDDPSSWPDRFPTQEVQEIERRRLHKIIENLVPWEASNDEQVLTEARWEIARSIAWGLGEEPPPRENGPEILTYLQRNGLPVYDPFSGSGSIPLEAQRLGLRTFGSDLNPVAVLIGKALVEIPHKFRGRPAGNPTAQLAAVNGQVRAWVGAQGLADDVRYYGEWMRNEAEKRVGRFYPKVVLADGSEAITIAWLWARTVRSPDPTAKGALVPLISSFMLSTKDSKKAWVEVIVDSENSNQFSFNIQTGPLTPDREKILKLGTKTGQATFKCVLTGANISASYIDKEAREGRMSTRLMAIVAKGHNARIYVSPNAVHESIVNDTNLYFKENFDDIDPPQQITRGTFASNAQGRRYCFERFSDYFTARQLIALTTFCDIIPLVRDEIIKDIVADPKSAPEFISDSARLCEGGTGAIAYADAVATYLSFCIDRATEYGSSLSTWLPDDNAIRGTFGRQAISMAWDFCEGSYFGESSAAFATIIRTISDVISHQRPAVPGLIDQIDAAKNGYPVRPCVINTDPPYYSNMEYADLSDFFYVWMKRSVGGIWPDLFRRLVTPKEEELVASNYRHGNQDTAEKFFMTGMGKALLAIRKAASDEFPSVIYYAFKQSETGTDGITSAGWASFLQAVVDAGLVIDGTWPLRTESAGRMIARGANALASSIVLVCRKRGIDASVVSRADFVRALKLEMPSAISAIRKAGVGPVDMPQSVIGPGMGVFTKFSKVLEDDDSIMDVKTALSLINRVWSEIENELDTNFDPETQVALAWFSTYGFESRNSGDLIMLANAKNIPSSSLFKSGVFEDQHGRARITPREKLPKNWSSNTDKSITIWECVQHTARVLNAADGGSQAAAKLVAGMGSKSGDARALAYRLYEVASQKSWSAEALVYNELAQEWTHLEDVAGKYGVSGKPTIPVLDLFGDASI